MGADISRGETPDMVSYIERDIAQMEIVVEEGLAGEEVLEEPRENLKRLREFVDRKESGESMVHRLRSWESGDTVYGYDSRSDSGGMGKTFRDGGEFGDQSALDAARDGWASATDPDNLLGGTTNDVFLWSATVESVRTDPPDPMDPGEPPLKFARLTDVKVLAFRPGDDA